MTTSTEQNSVHSLFQDALGSALLFNIPLAPYTTFHIGGPADMLLEAYNVETLVKAYRSAIEHNVKIWFLAGCSNVLIHDDGLRGLTLINRTNHISWDDENLQVTVDGGYNLDKLIFEISDRGWADITFAAGIPGSLGGALIGGAGAFGNLVHEFLLEVDMMRPNGERLTAPVDELGITYRTSAAKRRGDIILTAKMGNFVCGDRDKNLEEIKRIKAMRDEKHPAYGNSYSAGSFFKNLPPNEPGGWRVPAGKLLDECGCKGLRIGGAGVFDKHANIIVNYGNATCADINHLADEMAARVKAKFNIDLEREVQYLH